MSELYKEASKILDEILKKRGGLKSLVYSEDIEHKRSSLLLVCETIKYKKILDEIIILSKFKLNNKNIKINAMVYILLYDLLFGKKSIQGGGHIKKAILSYKNSIQTALARIKISKKVTTDIELLPPALRNKNNINKRYIRVNLLKTNIEEIFNLLKVEYPTIQKDIHINTLFILPSNTELHNHQLTKEGKIIIQDKASCFPAHILITENNNIKGDIIDACAAPGNKTSHLAMLLNKNNKENNNKNKKKVFAFDRSYKRLNILKNRMKNAGANDTVEPILMDFLNIDVNNDKYKNVTSILLDPSCSGSGMVNRLDHFIQAIDHLNNNNNENNHFNEKEAISFSAKNKKLEQIKQFQINALKKAFTFPNVQNIVYSTCSVYQEENEDVVSSILKWQNDTKQDAKHIFKLVKCLPTWTRRGLECATLTSQESDCMIRVDPSEDGTNGFFVAYFERITKGSNDVLINTSTLDQLTLISSEAKQIESTKRSIPSNKNQKTSKKQKTNTEN